MSETGMLDLYYISAIYRSLVHALLPVMLIYCWLNVYHCFQGHYIVIQPVIFSFYRYDKKKGFYCIESSTGVHKCLGGGKGRSLNYGPMDEKSRAYLEQVFATPNAYLKQLLTSLKYPIPRWLMNS